MKTYHQVHPTDFARYNTDQIRERFLIEKLVEAEKINFVYSHYDRMIVGAAHPINSPLKLGSYDELKSENFLDRREIGIVNIGGFGKVIADDQEFIMETLDCLYLGKGVKNVRFENTGGLAGVKFILFSCPAHAAYPARLMKPVEALPAEMGSLTNNNHRVINKYIHKDGIQSCQLVMGVTNFREGSIWNTMPPHTHDRRMEAYFYFNLPEDQRVIHFMGEPSETRHIFMKNEEAVFSPSWSIHSGVATANYSFIWAMAGENMEFTDMDAAPLKDLR